MNGLDIITAPTTIQETNIPAPEWERKNTSMCVAAGLKTFNSITDQIMHQRQDWLSLYQVD